MAPNSFRLVRLAWLCIAAAQRDHDAKADEGEEANNLEGVDNSYVCAYGVRQQAAFDSALDQSMYPDSIPRTPSPREPNRTEYFLSYRSFGSFPHHSISYFHIYFFFFSFSFRRASLMRGKLNLSPGPHHMSRQRDCWGERVSKHLGNKNNGDSD